MDSAAQDGPGSPAPRDGAAAGASSTNLRPSNLVSRHVPVVCQRKADDARKAARSAGAGLPTSLGTEYDEVESQAIRPDARRPSSYSVTGPRDHANSTTQKSQMIADSLDSMGGSDFALDGDSSLPEIYENFGACAIVQLPGYATLVSKLARRGDVSAEVVKRSLESHFASIIEHATEYQGDVVKVIGDAVVVVWRTVQDPNVINYDGLRRSSGHQLRHSMVLGESEDENSPSSVDACVLATLFCLSVSGILDHTEIWALEDYSNEFRGLRMPARCGVSVGTILDLHVGIDGVRVEHVPTGTAIRGAFDVLGYNFQTGEVGVTEKVWHLAADAFLGLGLVCKVQNAGPMEASNSLKSGYASPCILVKQEVLILKRSLSEVIASASKSVVTFNSTLFNSRLDLNSKPENISARLMVKRYISDIASAALHSARMAKEGNLPPESATPIYGWRDISVVAITIQWPFFTGFTAAKKSNFTVAKQAENDITLRAQLFISIVIKCCKLKGAELIGLWPASDSGFTAICILGFTSDLPHRISAVQFALDARDMISSHTSLASSADLCIAVFSGPIYHGLVKTQMRSEHRFVGEIIDMAVTLSIDPPSGGTGTVVVEEIGVYRAILGSHIAGYFGEQLNFEYLSAIAGKSLTVAVVPIHVRPIPRWKQTTIPTRPPLWQGSADIDIDDIVADQSELGYTDKKIGITDLCTQFAESPTNQIILIEGKAGIGKTTLLKFTKTVLDKLAVSLCVVQVPDLNFYSLLYPLNILIPQLFEILEAIMMEAERPKPKAGTDSNMHVAIAKKEISNTEVSRRSQSSQKRNSVYSIRQRPNTGFRKLVDSANALLGSMKSLREGPNKVKHVQQVNDQKVNSIVKACLQFANEDLDIAMPLLNAVLPIDVPETEATRFLGPDARTNLLQRLIARLINFVSSHKPIAFLLDDAHRMDSVTCQIITHISRQCPELLIVLGCAEIPNSDYRSAVISELRGLSQTIVYDLKGFEAQDVKEVICQKFGERISFVDNNVVECVMEKTKGCPFFVNTITSMLLDFPAVTVSQGVLQSASNSKEHLLAALPDTAQAAVLHNYIHLSSAEYKRFLLCAAIVGQRFTIEEVVTIWDEPEEEPNIVFRKIFHPPSHHLFKRLQSLIRLYSDAKSIIKRSFDSMDGLDRFRPFATVYQFQSSEMPETILSVADETSTRARRAKLILLYEHALTDPTEPLYIPLICKNLSLAKLTDRTSLFKRVQFLEMMGVYMITKSQSYIEARHIYNEIQSIVKDYHMEEEFGTGLLCEWHGRLAFAFGHGIPRDVDMNIALEHAKAGLLLFNINWPSTESAWWKFMVQGTFQLIGNFILFNIYVRPRQMLMKLRHGDKQAVTKKSGARYGRKAKAFEQTALTERYLKLEPLLLIISDHLFRTHARLRNQIAFDLLSVNVALKIGKKVRMAYGRLFSGLALKYWFMGGWDALSSVLLKYAETHVRKVAERADSIVFVTVSLHLTARGQWKRAHEYAQKGMDICLAKGEMKSWLLLASQRAFMHIYDGEFKSALQIEDKCKEESTVNGLRHGYVWATSISCCIHILCGRTATAKESLDLLLDGYARASAQQKAVIDGILSILHYDSDEITDGLDAIDRIVDLLPKMHYTNNQGIHGVLLGVLFAFKVSEEKTSTQLRERMLSITSIASIMRSSTMMPIKKVAPEEDANVSTMTKNDWIHQRSEKVKSFIEQKRALSLNVPDDVPAPFRQLSIDERSSVKKLPQASTPPEHKRALSITRPDDVPPHTQARQTSVEEGSCDKKSPQLFTVTEHRRALSITEPENASTPVRQTSIEEEGSSDKRLRHASTLTGPSGKNLKYQTKTTHYTIVHKDRLRAFATKCIEALKPFQRHSMAGPVISLLHALIQVLDGKVKFAGTTLRLARHAMDHKYPDSMALIKAVLATKSWRFGGHKDDRAFATTVFESTGASESLFV